MQLQKRATYVTHSIIYVGEKTQLHTLMLILGSNSQRVKSSCQYEKSNEKENRTEGVIFSYRFGGSRGLVKKKKKNKERKKEKKEGGAGGWRYGLLAKAEDPDIIMLVWFVGTLLAVKFTV